MRPTRNTTRLSATDIQQQMTHLATDVHRTANRIKRRRSDLTDEGYRKEWGRLSADHKLRAAQLAQLPERWAQQAVTARDQARAALLPTTDDPAAQMAAEATWQRVTSRPSYQSAEPAARWSMVRDAVQNMPASPARTLILEEAVARGDANPETVEALLVATSDDYRAARDAANHAQTAAQILNRRAAGIMHSLDTVDADTPGALSTVDVTAVPGADTLRDTGIGTDVFDGPNVPDLPVNAELPTGPGW